MKIIILSANETRHKFFRRYLNNQKKFNISMAICENNYSRQYYKVINSKNSSPLQKKHFIERKRYENYFFKNYNKKFKDPENTLIVARGEINTNKKINEKISKINPDLIISYGCGLIKDKIINKFKKKFINIHLGLSPYYRGSGSNYWPLVNNEPQLVGATFMKIDKGIDTGPILHQIRGNIKKKDNVHKIGNRIIFDMTKELTKLLNSKKKFTFVKKKNHKKLYLKKDFNDESLLMIKKNFKNKMIENYLKKKNTIDKKFKIVKFI